MKKEIEKRKNLPRTWFLESKVPYQKEKEKDKSLYSPQSKY